MLLLFLFGEVFCAVKADSDTLKGWDYINLHCRDNDNVPVDWWILYKPPSGPLPWEAGLNFSYISSTEGGKWIPSRHLITGNSMLKHTLSPLFRITYQDHLGVATYFPKPGSSEGPGSAARGLLLADEFSGVWITHTVPGLPDITKNRLYFPDEELKNGHLIVCLSADFITMNELARKLRVVEPHVMTMRLSDSVKEWLPDLLPMSIPLGIPVNSTLEPKPLYYVTKDRTLRAEVMVRQPGDKRCLQQIFAETHNIVLDVYGHDNDLPTACEAKYGVRIIDAISLNYADFINDDKKQVPVVYINKRSDRLQFGVSTAAAWQRRGGTPDPEYWVCIGSSADDASGKGDLILCIEDYDVWRPFDTLKIKEPEC